MPAAAMLCFGFTRPGKLHCPQRGRRGPSPCSARPAWLRAAFSQSAAAAAVPAAHLGVLTGGVVRVAVRGKKRGREGRGGQVKPRPQRSAVAMWVIGCWAGLAGVVGGPEGTRTPSLYCNCKCWQARAAHGTLGWAWAGGNMGATSPQRPCHTILSRPLRVTKQVS